MTLKNVTRVVFGRRRAEILRILQKIENWLGGRDSNPDTVVQRSVHRRRCASVRSVSDRLSRQR